MISKTKISKSVCLLIFSLLFQTSISASKNFPVRGSMKVRVNFWEKVYTEISTKEAFVHDPEDLSVIYKKVKLILN